MGGRKEEGKGRIRQDTTEAGWGVEAATNIWYAKRMEGRVWEEGKEKNVCNFEGSEREK